MTMEKRLAGAPLERLSAMICAALGLLGLVLADRHLRRTRFSVDQRQREIGIRSAVGARPGGCERR
jgi:hypothetical protein